MKNIGLSKFLKRNPSVEIAPREFHLWQCCCSDL